MPEYFMCEVSMTWSDIWSDASHRGTWSNFSASHDQSHLIVTGCFFATEGFVIIVSLFWSHFFNEFTYFEIFKKKF